MSTDAAKTFMNAMFLLHITHCLTGWGQINKITPKLLESLYKQTIKALDNKPQGHHDCKILKRPNWKNMHTFSRLCLVLKVLNNMAPPPLCTYITLKTSQTTKATTRGDCLTTRRLSSFGQSAFSVRASKDWNNLLQHIFVVSVVLHDILVLRSASCCACQHLCAKCS